MGNDGVGILYLVIMKTVKIISPLEHKSLVGNVTIRSYKSGTLTKVLGAMDSIRNRDYRWPERADEKNRRAQAFIDSTFAKNILYEFKQKNLVMQGTNTGTGLLIQRLVGVTTYSGTVNYGSLGSSSTAPAVTDTQLGAEVARVIPSTFVAVNPTMATFQFFFPDANLPNGTYPEWGTFVDGSATLNSGQIFNHALLSTPYSKSSGTDTTVQQDFSVTSS